MTWNICYQYLRNNQGEEMSILKVMAWWDILFLIAIAVGFIIAYPDPVSWVFVVLGAIELIRLFAKTR